MSARVTTRPRRFAAVVAAFVALAASAGCGIQPDAGPRDIPEDQRTLPILGGAGVAAEGADRIYLVGPGGDQLLRSVPREEVPGFDLIRILLLGPNETESAAQFATVIPTGTELVSTPVRSGSTLFVDLTEQFNELTGDGLTRALAQIVYTAAEIEGVELVRLRVEGEALTWPTGNGENTAGSLSIYDYPGFVLTSQPAYPAVPVA